MNRNGLYRKASSKLVLFCAFLTLFTLQNQLSFGNPLPVTNKPSQVDKKVDFFYGTIQDVLIFISRKYNISIGLISSGEKNESTKRRFFYRSLQSSSPKELLDSVSNLFPEYYWRQSGETYFFSQKSEKLFILEDLFKAKVDLNTITPSDSKLQVRVKLLESPDVNLILKKYELRNFAFEFSNHNLKFKLNFPDEFKSSNLSLIEVLAFITKSKEYSFWKISFSGKDVNFIDLNFF